MGLCARFCNSLMVLETNVLAQTTFMNKCGRLHASVFYQSHWFYSISVFYLLVRKNLFTFRIPVSSERWPVLIYPLSSPCCPLAPSLPPPTPDQCNFLHPRNSLTHFHLLCTSSCKPLAVSTVSKSPVTSSWWRLQLDHCFGRLRPQTTTGTEWCFLC